MEDYIQYAKSNEEKKDLGQKYKLRMEGLSDLEDEVQSNIPSIINEVVDAVAKDCGKLIREQNKSIKTNDNEGKREIN